MMKDFFPFLLFAISSSLTPGPNNFMLMNSGMHFGTRRSLPHYFGICLGFAIMILIVAIGLGAVFTQYAWIKYTLKILGSAYMLYLAYQVVISHSKPENAATKKPLTFLQASLFQWVNPKAWMMGVGAIAIFVLSDNYVLNAVLISFIYFITCIFCTGAWLVLGNYLQVILKTDRHRIWFNIIMAVALVASIVKMIFE
jgi:threonine/homoserine/homoserine lactone efflux protein